MMTNETFHVTVGPYLMGDNQRYQDLENMTIEDVATLIAFARKHGIESFDVMITVDDESNA